MKILLIGISHSSHTESWFDLVNSIAGVDVKLFGVGGTKSSNICYKYQFYYEPIKISFFNRVYFKVFKILNLNIFLPIPKLFRGEEEQQFSYFKGIVDSYEPDIIHTLGLYPSALFFVRSLKLLSYRKFKWVHTFRGGPELTLNKDVNLLKLITEKCDFILCDNQLNYKILINLGVDTTKFNNFNFPGTGGIELEIYEKRVLKASESRVIIIPKAYECDASKALPIIEALRNIWPRIQPCKVILLAATKEVNMWYNELPTEIVNSTIIYDRINRKDFLELLLNARVVVSPSLIDGIPNVMYEAMATGVVPILSPLDTFIEMFKDKINVFYAKNLYVNELEKAIFNAMNDDKLVDSITDNNIEYIRQLANRNVIRRNLEMVYSNIIRL